MMDMKCNKHNQLYVGQKIEMEHHLGKKMALKIAKDHVREDPCYYSHLLAMEKKYKKR